LVQPEKRRFGSLNKFNQSNFKIQNKKQVRFNKQLFSKKSSSSSGTRKKMVIVNPSAISKNELGIPEFKKGVVIVSPRIIGGDSESKSPPEVQESDYKPIQLKIREHEDAMIEYKKKDDKHSVLGEPTDRMSLG
jgi:hypothetical protein